MKTVMHSAKIILSNVKYIYLNSSLSKRYCHLHAITRPYYLSGTEKDVISLVSKDFNVFENFISQSEEIQLMEEIEPLFKRRRYEFNHWDDAIQGYKESDNMKWSEGNLKILDRLQEAAFRDKSSLIQDVHVLDLSKSGFIKPHIDSVRFCGDTIAGISLLSPCVMRLVHKEKKDAIVDVLLERRSLYIMKGHVRYHFTHEILKEDLSVFKGEHIPRERRISIICRNKPNPEDTN